MEEERKEDGGESFPHMAHDLIRRFITVLFKMCSRLHSAHFSMWKLVFDFCLLLSIN